MNTDLLPAWSCINQLQNKTDICVNKGMVNP